MFQTLYELVRNNSNQIWESNLNHENQNSKQLTLKNNKKTTSKDIKYRFYNLCEEKIILIYFFVKDITTSKSNMKVWLIFQEANIQASMN